MQVIMRETGQQKAHFMGESSGALRAGLYATIEPERVDRLVLAAFTYKGTDTPTLKKRAEQVEYFRTHNLRKRDRAMIESIFTRDKPGTTDPGVGKILADVEIAIRRSDPNRYLSRHDRQSSGCRPEKSARARAVGSRRARRHRNRGRPVRLLSATPHGDKQLVILPNTAHSVAVSINRHLFWHAVRSFLDMPAPAAI
jgi:pimeloyl-ACP methyl ester carboxylesterase